MCEVFFIDSDKIQIITYICWGGPKSVPHISNEPNSRF